MSDKAKPDTEDKPEPEPAPEPGGASQSAEGPDSARRKLLTNVGRVAMGGGLVASYGTCAGFSGAFLYPAQDRPRHWYYVTEVASMAPGSSVRYRTPGGERVNIARRGDSGKVDDFIALSSTCPHLGCQVHWQGDQNRFFCPCHNGVFTPEGVATAGPPGEAGQSLSRYPLRVEGGLLYIEVPEAAIAAAEPDDCGAVEDPFGPPGPGHDPCLYPLRKA